MKGYKVKGFVPETYCDKCQRYADCWYMQHRNPLKDLIVCEVCRDS